MTDSRDNTRRYGDKDISRILRRAVEIQEEQPDSQALARRDGLTLSDLEEVAREAGIDPRHLRRAVAEVDTVNSPSNQGMGTKLAGSPVTVVVERVVPGEVHQDDFERFVPEMQRNSPGHGQPSLLGRTLTWRSDTPNNTRSLQVTVNSRDGETRIRAEERLHGIAGGLFGGLMGGVGMGVGMPFGLIVGLEALGSVLFAVVAPLGVVGASYLGARLIFQSVARKRRRALEDLVDRLAEVGAAVVSRDTLDSGVERDARRGLPSG